MERLTRKVCGGWGVVKGCELNTLKGAKAVVNRLAAYEDTGLEPEELKRIGSLFSDDSCVGMDFLSACIDTAKSGISADRIRELAEADKAGRLVVLPCKMGDAVWVVDCEYMDCSNCGHLEHGKYCPYIDKPVCPNGTVRQERFHYSLIPNFWKTVFLTREEAEAALKGDSNETDSV